MKNIGKPCAGKPHARFDEGGLLGCKGQRFKVVACDEMSAGWWLLICPLLYRRSFTARFTFMTP